MTCCQQSALKGLKLKNTPRRRAVLECLASATTYVSPDEVWQALQGRFSRLGLPTVYRIMEELAAGGLIDKVLHPTWKMARPGRVRVAFGPPLKLTGDDYEALAKEVEDAVKRL